MLADSLGGVLVTGVALRVRDYTSEAIKGITAIRAL